MLEYQLTGAKTVISTLLPVCTHCTSSIIYQIILDDHSRVPLEIDYSSTGSDYINASFVEASVVHREMYNTFSDLQGFLRPCEYIATQGPVTSTFGDFWKMIWERRCSTIVMLTNLKEDDKVCIIQYNTANLVYIIYFLSPDQMPSVLAIIWLHEMRHTQSDIKVSGKFGRIHNQSLYC